MLAVQLEISKSDRVRVEATVWTARRETLRTARRLADATVDYDLCDVDILRLKLARHALY
jgi:hypothetical protein